MIKKILTTALSIAMIFTTIQSASAQIEVWEFDDGSRLTRFHRDDLDDMVALYDQYVQENNRKLFTKGQNIAIKTLGITAGASAVIGGLVLASNPPASAADKFGGTVLIFAGLASIVASFYPEYVAYKVPRINTKDAYLELTGDEFVDERKRNSISYFGLQDIRDMLIKEKNLIEQVLRDGKEDRTEQVAKMEEACPGLGFFGQFGLTREKLQQRAGYYVLLERPYGSSKPTDNEYIRPVLWSDYWLGEDWTENKCKPLVLKIISSLGEEQNVHGKNSYVLNHRGLSFDKMEVGQYGI